VNRGASKAHLAYGVDDLGAFVSRLEAAGIGVERGVPIPGHDRVELRDPFGNRVELIQRLSVPSQTESGEALS
jgi:catechol 2,3-dioxygenase-like lactoylglutathione lyase family enzyme